MSTPGRGRRWAMRLLGTVTILVPLAATVLAAAANVPQPAQLPVFVAVVAVYVACGCVIIERAPGNVVGPIVYLIGLLIGAFVVLDPLIRSAASERASTIGAFLVSQLDAPVYLLSVLLFLRFPDGRLPSAGWRWVERGAVALAIVVALGAAVRPGPSPYYPGQANPLGDQANPIGAAWGVAYMLLVAAVGVAALSLVARWRRAGPVVRAQLKWVAAAAVVLAISMLTYGGNVGPGVYSQAGDLIVGIGFALVPVAVTVAILRYRLYEIDRLISRTIGWAVISAVLLLVFVVAVVALQSVLAGITQGQTLAVAASTLLAFALFQPIRRRIQRAVDRRFDRTRYDAERVAESFAGELGRGADLGGATRAQRSTAGDAMQPTSVAIWLRRRADA